MSSVIAGLVFILFSFDFPFYSETLKEVINIDVLPDFIGYLLIWFGLEKVTVTNRWFKDSSSIAVGLMVITFFTFLSQIRFLFSSYLETDGQVFAVILSLFSLIIEKGQPTILALCMFFLGMYSTGIGHEMGNIKNRFLGSTAYGFSVIYAILIVVNLVNQFIVFPFEMWIIMVPINLVFLLYNVISLGKIKEFN